MCCGRDTEGRDVSRGDIIYLDSTVRSDTVDQSIWSGGTVRGGDQMFCYTVYKYCVHGSGAG